MAQIDHNQIKTKIVAILKANFILFDANDLTKIRSIEVGFPEGDPFNPENMDQIFITNGTPFETITHDAGVISNTVTALTHIFNYDIVTVVNASTAREAENKLDDVQKLIVEILETNNDLAGTGTKEVDMSFPVTVQPYKGSQSQGKPVGGRVITLRCFITTV